MQPLRTFMRPLAALMPTLVSALVSGCGSDARPNDSDPAPDAQAPAALTRCSAMDVMFVIDDSNSMSQEQANLIASFPEFVNVLNRYEVEPGRPLDFRVAVTSTGRDERYTLNLPPAPMPIYVRGRNGAFVDTGGAPRRWLERSDPDLVSAFAQRANLGIEGPTFEMPLYMTQMALRERMADGINAGFLRDDALLAVVMITDEDDCSRTDNDWIVTTNSNPCFYSSDPARVSADQTIAFLDYIKGGRGRWAASVIAARQDCRSGFGDATSAPRLVDFVNQVNRGAPAAEQNAVFSSICEGTLAPALEQALDTFQQACENFPPAE